MFFQAGLYQVAQHPPPSICWTSKEIWLSALINKQRFYKIDHDHEPDGFQVRSSDTPLITGSRNSSISVAISWKDSGTWSCFNRLQKAAHVGWCADMKSAEKALIGAIGNSCGICVVISWNESADIRQTTALGYRRATVTRSGLLTGGRSTSLYTPLLICSIIPLSRHVTAYAMLNRFTHAKLTAAFPKYFHRVCFYLFLQTNNPHILTSGENMSDFL